MVADEAEATLGTEPPAVEGDDAGRFLTAMLERMQAERGNGRGLGMAENTDYAAFLAQAIAIEIDADSHDALVLCDGRREMRVPAGGRLEVTKCSTPLKWVRLDSAPFTDRLVRKFRLPVTGWRGQ